MANQENEEVQNQSGDPGRTPGSAEGDRETVEADLREKENEQDTRNYEENKEKKISESTSRSSQ